MYGMPYKSARVMSQNQISFFGLGKNVPKLTLLENVVFCKHVLETVFEVLHIIDAYQWKEKSLENIPCIEKTKKCSLKHDSQQEIGQNSSMPN